MNWCTESGGDAELVYVDVYVRMQSMGSFCYGAQLSFVKAPNSTFLCRQNNYEQHNVLANGRTGKVERVRARRAPCTLTFAKSGFNAASRGACASLAPANPDQALRKLFLVACVGECIAGAALPCRDEDAPLTCCGLAGETAEPYRSRYTARSLLSERFITIAERQP